MVAERAVKKFKECLKSFELDQEKVNEQNYLLDKIAEVKSEEGDGADTVRLIDLMGIIVESLIGLTIIVTDAGQERLQKCREEVANANSIIVKGTLGTPQRAPF